MAHDILLESGTNEVELAEFKLSGQVFGVNVAKIKEFIPFKGLKLNHPPGGHASVAGVFFLRGKAIPLVDLDRHLNLAARQGGANQVVVVTDFNNQTTAFVADEINQIHRLSWSEFKPLTHVLASRTPRVTGVVSVEGQEVLVLDLEQIIGEIFPETFINYDERKYLAQAKPTQRGQIKLLFAEDSAIIRARVAKTLKAVGYGQILAHDNGQAAFEALVKLREQAQTEGRDLSHYLNLVLTDIEMPQLDGLTLCRQIKAELGLKLPVVIFSSLINEQMIKKCQQVGADGYAAKPDTDKVIGLIDDLCLARGGGGGKG